MKKVKLAIKLPVSILKEDKKFIAYTPALDLSTSGKSYKEVKKRFEEIVEIFIEETIETNTLDEVLTDLGWKHVRKEWKPPIVISEESQTIEIPVTI